MKTNKTIKAAKASNRNRIPAVLEQIAWLVTDVDELNAKRQQLRERVANGPMGGTPRGEGDGVNPFEYAENTIRNASVQVYAAILANATFDECANAACDALETLLGEPTFNPDDFDAVLVWSAIDVYADLEPSKPFKIAEAA